MKRNSRKKGFTLTELLITIAVLAILAVIAVPVISGLFNKGNDTSEDVNAALYTSIMNKFAAEEVNTATAYPRLTASGANAEYTIFSAKAGKGTFPGFNIISGTSDADALKNIRKEAVIAIKAFSDTAVSDDYYIPAPADSEYEYVYFYLTGDVKKMKRSELNTASASDYLNGTVNVADYWVYLSREGGSGAALGGVSYGEGHLYIQVLQYGTGTPIDNATVTVTSGAKTYTAVTSADQNGFVGFSNIPVGTVSINVSAYGAVSFPNSSFYAKTGELFISENGYEGCQMNSPYVVDLKLGSLGSLGFYEEKMIWNSGQWNVERTKLTANVTATSSFTADTSNPGGNPRSVSYSTNLRTAGGVQPLLIGNKFLTYGNYTLSVSAYGYRSYRESVKSTVFGIDNSSGTYSGRSSPYEYPIVMKAPTGKGSISGIIEYEKIQQPLRDTPGGLIGTWASTSNSTVYARVKLVRHGNGSIYYSGYLTETSTGKYSYSISNLPDGTYDFEIDSPYHYDNMIDFPETVTIDGRHVEVSGKVKTAEAGTGTSSGTVTYNYLGDYDPIPGVTVRLRRFGNSSYAATLTTDQDGKFSSPDLTCGFYQLYLSLPTSLGGYTYNYRLFISNDENCTIRLAVPTATLSGSVIPYMSSGTQQTKSGTLYDLTVQFTRVNATGTKNYSSTYAEVDTGGVKATFTVNLVPGYYRVTLNSLCYSDAAPGQFTLSSAGSEKTYSMYVDMADKDNHEGFVMKSNASYHWNECKNCSAAFNQAAHSKSDWKYKSTSTCYRECTVCKYVTDGPSNHTMTSYVSKAASCTVNGERVYYCSRGCGYTYTEAIAKSGHVGNGIWVYDKNGSASNKGTHHQNCKNCGTTLNANTACSRGGFTSNGQTNHYDNCSVCSGKRYFNHSWGETSRTGHTCTGGTIYYKCSGCGATKTGSYGATTAHNMRGKCSKWHACSWNSYCSAKGTHVWNGYYHILCTMCGAADDAKWCAMHCGSSMPIVTCPY